MRSILFWLYILSTVIIYAQKPIINSKDINSLIPEGFIKDFNLNIGESESRVRTAYSEDMVIKQRITRYTYEIYDIAIKDIPDKVRNNFFAGSIFVERDKNNRADLIEPYNTQGYITRENIVGLLNDVSQNEYVLFDDCKEIYSKIRFLLYRKIRYNNKIIGEMSLRSLQQENISWPRVYCIECAFLNGEDRISFIKLFCYDWDWEMVSCFSEYSKKDTQLNIWKFISGGEEKFISQIETRSARLPVWMLKFLDYYDKLFTSVQNLFDMQLPLDNTIFFATDNLNIRESSGVSGKQLSMAKKGSTLNVIEVGRKETIDGITAPWVRVRLEDGTEGWCFAGYITAKKIYKAVLGREMPIIKNPENGNKKLDSIDHLIIDNKMIRLGNKKPKGMISNTILEAPFMEFYKFGDIEGYESHDTIIGWNNMNAVIFITTIDPAARTQSGITIGSSRQEVIRAYGEEYSSTKNRMQYINNEFELVGMIFYFENNKVIRITCFTHI